MNTLNGILLLDKPEGWTSHDVVAKARRFFQTKAIGHCGTLDPMASGLLILLIGNATKLSDFLLTQDKTYLTTIQLGLTTDTFDMTGEVLTQTPCDLSKDKIEKAIQSLTGDIELEVPIFSAAKVKGKKLYEYARENKTVELPKKIMNFYNIKILEVTPERVSVQLSCSKGSFIRAWGHRLGQELNVGGTLKELRRIESLPWSIENAISMEKLNEIFEKDGFIKPESLGKSFIPASKALPHLKSVIADLKEEKLISNGQIPHSVSSRLVFELKQAAREGTSLGVKVLSSNDQRLLAILQTIPGKGLKIRRVFKNDNIN
ncbi:MAG: tRNA pseudouridine(55) synthase TruB [Bdellovibrionales bacterium]|nr:tRNA pseudouridine(55) synthase TruB [Bdellovibrionales bacterium]